MSDPQYSKEELRYKIQWMTRLATQEGMADLYGPAECEGQYDDSIDLLKTAIQRYTVMLETAPEENPRASATGPSGTEGCIQSRPTETG